MIIPTPGPSPEGDRFRGGEIHLALSSSETAFFEERK
jgi:hypothetical protein